MNRQTRTNFGLRRLDAALVFARPGAFPSPSPSEGESDVKPSQSKTLGHPRHCVGWLRVESRNGDNNLSRGQECPRYATLSIALSMNLALFCSYEHETKSDAD
jgi:hypothetical protein